MSERRAIEAMLLRWGETSAGRTDLQEIIMRDSMPVTETGCWIWLGTLFGSGYGDLKQGAPVRRAHRASWLAFRGPLPSNALVLHKCDVPCCVNPDHLFLGSHKDNHADKVRKGRQARGQAHGRAKLTAAEALVIRNSGETNHVMAARYGIGKTTVQSIRSGKNWGWL